MTNLGRTIYAAAALLAGVTYLAWRDFAPYWVPVPEGTPARAALACAAGVVALAGAIALLRPRGVRAGAAAIAGLYLIYALLWSRRIIGFPAIFGTWAGTAEELAQAIGGAILFLAAAGRPAEQDRGRAACIALFGLCTVSFGVVHFDAMAQTAAMVPAWIPGGGRFWAALTGLCDVAAGLALLSGVLDRLAARLLTAMFALFSVLIWFPRLAAAPDHIAWAGNAVNLALVASAWIVAENIAARGALPRLWGNGRSTRGAALTPIQAGEPDQGSPVERHPAARSSIRDAHGA